ncbi:hypothetical protein TSOC_006684 [Tetrabaena socialis]|uniref:AP2/ERF domain-containing protein n=1 Tax=Tetrabaena socialis TaxID=47790 RepID=A0A2J8A2Z0_9CHLO|nr:hypothetical protein TSOC_006684 [Tetrabaena socialis]|eukprot:PNH06885.1 hypothetical protein TSOC_006684 [Tetrabaena socialis]
MGVSRYTTGGSGWTRARQRSSLLVCLYGEEKPLNLPDEMPDERRAALAVMDVEELKVELLSGPIFASGGSAYRGVSFNRPNNSWHARIKVGGKNKHLGHFAHTDQGEIEAACAYDDAATAYLHEQSDNHVDQAAHTLLFRGIWAAVQPLLQERTRKKIIILGSDYLQCTALLVVALVQVAAVMGLFKPGKATKVSV